MLLSLEGHLHVLWGDGGRDLQGNKQGNCLQLPPSHHHQLPSGSCERGFACSSVMQKVRNPNSNSV